MLRGEGWVVAGLSNLFARPSSVRIQRDLAMPSLVDLVPQPWPSPTHFVPTSSRTDTRIRQHIRYPVIGRPILPFFHHHLSFLVWCHVRNIGHGLFLFCVGLTFVVWNEKANDNSEAWRDDRRSSCRRYMILQ
jgi:hypothetical protein